MSAWGEMRGGLGLYLYPRRVILSMGITQTPMSLTRVAGGTVVELLDLATEQYVVEPSRSSYCMAIQYTHALRQQLLAASHCTALWPQLNQIPITHHAQEADARRNRPRDHCRGWKRTRAGFDLVHIRARSHPTPLEEP